MRVRLTIFILSAFLLGGSLLAPVQRSVFSKHHEVKVATVVLSKAMIVDEDFVWGKTSAPVLYVIVNFSLAKVHASQGLFKTLPPFARKTVKYYLLFRVLRN